MRRASRESKPSIDGTSPPPDRLVVEIGTSPALAVALAALHGGGAVIVAILPLPWPARLALLAFVAASLCLTLARHALRCSPAAVVALAFGVGDGCALRRRGEAAWEEGRVVERWVHPRLTLLAVRLRERRFALGVAIPADAVAPEPFRRLRVRLRLGTSAD